MANKLLVSTIHTLTFKHIYTSIYFQVQEIKIFLLNRKVFEADIAKIREKIG